MAGYSLNADYDNDGQVTGGVRERSLRNREPGVLLIPNLDVDKRKDLPKKVEKGNKIALDSESTVSDRSDDEPVELQVLGLPFVPPAQLFLSVTNIDAERIAIHDAQGRRITGQVVRDRTQYPLSGPGKYTLQATTFAAAPRKLVKLNETKPANPPSPVVRVRLESVTDGLMVTEDEGLFSIAPFLVAGDDQAPERVYLCNLKVPPKGHIGDDNYPTVTDVQTALDEARIALVLVPVEVTESTEGDTWLQDQFQFGWCNNATRQLRVVFHLPRLRIDGSPTELPRTAANFVDEHLPSKDLGVYRGFWEREIEVMGMDGKPMRISFLDSIDAFVQLYNIFELRAKIAEGLALLLPTTEVETLLKRTGGLDPDLWQAAITLDALLQSYKAEAARRLPQSIKAMQNAEEKEQKANEAFSKIAKQCPPAGANEQQRWQEEKAKLQREAVAAHVVAASWKGLVMKLTKDPTKLGTEVDNVRSKFVEKASPPYMLLQLPSGEVEVAMDQVQSLYYILIQWHSSHNYGGNIEVAPATSTAERGTIIIGNATHERADKTKIQDMDPDLVAFLRGQKHGGQQVVEIDTSWLEVGHVDEMFAFPPSPAKGAILRASPKLALDILEAVRDRYRAGLDAQVRAQLPDPWEYDGNRIPYMWAGANPVTMLLRGLEWLHKDKTPSQRNKNEDKDKNKDEDTNIPLPRIYYAKFLANLKSTGTPLPLPFPVTRDPPINTATSVFEVLAFGAEANRMWETKKFAPAVDILQQKYPETRMIELPVLFDLPSMGDGKTSAFTPDLINHLTIGQYILVPRPYGPRVRPDLAASILGELAKARGLSSSRFSAAWMRRHKLNTTWYWARRNLRIPDFATGNYSDLTRIAELFLDGFTSRFPEVIGKGDSAAFLATLRQDDDWVKRIVRLISRVEKLIRAENPGAFLANGYLTKDWVKIRIPEGIDKEGTVDLFEAWTEAAADELGLRVTWVDGWYYHLRFGTIHCGTNVLRKALPNVTWWKQTNP